MAHWGWKRKQGPLDMSALGMMIVIVWKATGGSWEAAFAAGAFYITLVPRLPSLRK
jgi:hypothetical protein